MSSEDKAAQLPESSAASGDVGVMGAPEADATATSTALREGNLDDVEGALTAAAAQNDQVPIEQLQDGSAGKTSVTDAAVDDESHVIKGDGNKDEALVEDPATAPETAADAKGISGQSGGGLQLEDVPPPSKRQSIELDMDARKARSRASTLSRPFTPSMHHAPDSPTTSLITTLRQQLELVTQQSELLNAKLVASISKHADLEDQIFSLQTDKEEQTKEIGELARAKAQWEESMNTGLLVERSQIKDEMQRLASGLVEEERKRGTAEEKRKQVEDEVDELAATLFDQANTMVATERMSRAQAEERLKETEDNLAAAEAAVRDMQTHLQSLTTTASAAPAAPQVPRRFLASHPPFAEFRTLLVHLRAGRPSARARARHDVRDLYPAPTVSSLLAQPFLARCVVEDYEPTLRLDTASTLGWVSRRTVSSAIIAGDLVIEPVGAASLGPPETLNCALCGRAVIPGGGTAQKGLMKFFASPGTVGSSTPSSSASHSQGSGHARGHSHSNSLSGGHSSVYVFRVSTDKEPKSYPLCKNGWCLERLRAACALWHFVRTGIVHPVWFAEDGSEQPHTPQPPSTAGTDTTEPRDDGTPVRIDLNATPPDADKLTMSPAPPEGQPRSVSGPAGTGAASGSGAITVEALAAAEHKRPDPRPAQRKSGWGLGSFGLGSSGKSSGGWTSWGSRPSTPATPSTHTDDSKREVRAASASAALGAPIDLDPETSAAGATAGPSTATDASVEGIAAKEGASEFETKEDRPAVEAAASVAAEGDSSVAADETKEVAEATEIPLQEAAAALTDPTDALAAAADAPAASGDAPAVAADAPAASADAPDVAADAAADADATSEKPALLEPTPDAVKARSESRASHHSHTSTDAGSFATPSSEHAPLPDTGSADGGDEASTATATGAVTPAHDEEGDAATAETEASAEPKEDDDAANGSSDVPVPPRSTKRAPPPPPLPKRSARRPVGEPTPPATPTEEEGANAVTPTVATSGQDTESAAADATPSAPTVATKTSSPHPPPPRHPLAVMNSPVRSPGSPHSPRSPGVPSSPGKTGSATLHAPPPSHRPPSTGAPAAARRASAGTTSISPSGADAEAEGRTFVVGDGWEARTWRQVIRLKEDMWRARVGVVDDEES